MDRTQVYLVFADIRFRTVLRHAARYLESMCLEVEVRYDGPSAVATDVCKPRSGSITDPMDTAVPGPAQARRKAIEPAVRVFAGTRGLFVGDVPCDHLRDHRGDDLRAQAEAIAKRVMRVMREPETALRIDEARRVARLLLPRLSGSYRAELDADEDLEARGIAFAGREMVRSEGLGQLLWFAGGDGACEPGHAWFHELSPLRAFVARAPSYGSESDPGVYLRSIALRLALRHPGYRKALLELGRKSLPRGADAFALFEALFITPFANVREDGRIRMLVVLDVRHGMDVACRETLFNVFRVAACLLPSWFMVALIESGRGSTLKSRFEAPAPRGVRHARDAASWLDDLAQLMICFAVVHTARRCMQLSIAKSVRLLGDEDVRTATRIIGLAVLLDESGQHRSAGRYYERAMAIHQSYLARADAPFGGRRQGRTSSLEDLIEMQRAWPLYCKAMELRERILGELARTTIVGE